VSLRVAPEALNSLIGFVEKQGNIVQHTTEREDKTAQVIDAEARIKNLTSFRDNLRSMQAKSSTGVKDLVEIQRQLTEVQSQLDSEATKRKVLANQKEKIAVGIVFRVEGSRRGGGLLEPIRAALQESGRTLAESLGALITVLVAAIPWMIILMPAGWFVVKAWRKARRKRRTGADETGQ
jgi:hypothetical protein